VFPDAESSAKLARCNAVCPFELQAEESAPFWINLLTIRGPLTDHIEPQAGAMLLDYPARSHQLHDY
jgi:hypothetical protein